MIKKRFLILLSACFIIFCAGLPGCTSRTDNADTSPSPTDTVQTEVNDSPSQDSMDAIDYSQYLKKIWIKEDKLHGYNTFSFIISKIENNKIEGKFSVGLRIKPDFYFYTRTPSVYLGDLAGTVNHNIAECRFSDNDEHNGAITMLFKENGEIDATIEYMGKETTHLELYLDGTYHFRPYNIGDNDPSLLEKHSFSVDLNSWGTVFFKVFEMSVSDKKYTLAFLTNECDDILYEFGGYFHVDSEITEASIKDVNDDGLKDIMIITDRTGSPDTAPMEWVFYQMDDGSFYNSDLDAPPQNSMDTIDYDQYLKKIWIVEGENDDVQYDYSSFFITKIENGKIEGKFSTGSVMYPSFCRISSLNLYGTITDGKAECHFSHTNANKGNVTLVFKENDRIEARIEYTSKEGYYQEKSMDGTFLFKPYNLADIKDSFTPFEEDSFAVDLDSWGNVIFVAGQNLNSNKRPVAAFLTNHKGDILYCFGGFPNNVPVRIVSFQDIDGDALKDMIVLLGDENDSAGELARVYFQNADGTFYSDEELAIEIYCLDNIRGVNDILDYLSERRENPNIGVFDEDQYNATKSQIMSADRVALTGEDFGIMYNGMVINKDTRVEDVIENLGIIGQEDHWNNHGALWYPTKGNPEIRIYVSVKDGHDYILNIYLENYGTNKGLKVGDELERVLRLYGKPDNLETATCPCVDYHLIYEKDGTVLKISLNKDKQVNRILLDFYKNQSDD